MRDRTETEPGARIGIDREIESYSGREREETNLNLENTKSYHSNIDLDECKEKQREEIGEEGGREERRV